MKNNKTKTFIIDTNVLIHRSDAILSFKDCEVVIPIWVLEELDKLKTYSDERGRNARQAIRFIEERTGHNGVAEGVKIENRSILRIALEYDKKLAADLPIDRMDNKIIFCALTIQHQASQLKKENKVFFVSKDINARVKARALGLHAVDYEKQKAYLSTLYSGYKEASVSGKIIDDLLRGERVEWQEDLFENEFLLLKDNTDKKVTARFHKPEEGSRYIEYVETYENNVSGILPLNPQQQMAFDLLLDDSVSLVTLVGKAGTGKTLLALAAGLKKVFESKVYSRVLASRPIMPLGKDIGFLPGDKSEKLSHWMKPLVDNLELIVSVTGKPEYKNVDVILNSNKVEIEAITYIRGRSLPKQYILVDEAQNLSPHEIKTIVSRAGKDSKVILTGDPYQIDSPYLDSDSNGLTYLVEAFKGQKIFGHVTLAKSERSELAELAAELL
ncbi:MAG: PhoH family protein [Spirochaetales bacterium]|nr:PhoH family protein [Spirochaetales bacterium]